MKISKKKIFCCIFLIFVFFLIDAASVLAAENLRAAKILDYSGQVTIKKVGGEKTFSAFKGMSLSQGDTVTTGKGAWISLELDKDKKVKIAEKSQVIISELIEKNKKEKTILTLNSGKIWTNIKKKLNTGSKYEIKTPTAVMGVRGTKFFVGHEKGRNGGNTDVAVLEGTVTSTVSLGRSTATSQERKIEIVLDINKQMSFNEHTLDALNNALGSKPAPTQKEIQSAAQQASGMQDVVPEQLDSFVLNAIKEDPEGIGQKLLESINNTNPSIDNTSEGNLGSGDNDALEENYLVSLENSKVLINGSEMQTEAVIENGITNLKFIIKNNQDVGLSAKNIKVKEASDTINYFTGIDGIKDTTINFHQGIYQIFFEESLKTVIYCVQENHGVLKLSGKVAQQEKPIKSIRIEKEGENIYEIQYLTEGPLRQSLALPAGNYSLTLFSVGENNFLIEQASFLDFQITSNTITNLIIE